MKHIWMKVTKDKYQLPLAVADSASELARICGTTPNSIVSTFSHYRKGRIDFSSYICVQIEEGDEDDK